jgi:hypothetical protein
MTTVLVSGAIANKYLNGGEAWVRLSWALGLRKLGFRVYFVEQIGRDRSGVTPVSTLPATSRLLSVART